MIRITSEGCDGRLFYSYVGALNVQNRHIYVILKALKIMVTWGNKNPYKQTIYV